MPLQHANQHSLFFEENEECSCQSEAVIVPTVMKEEYLNNWRQYILIFSGEREKTKIIGQNVFVFSNNCLWRRQFEKVFF